MYKVLERHLHPSVYKRFDKTRELKKKGVDPDEFYDRGGLDEETFEALKNRWKGQKQAIEDRKQGIISKYGSLEAAPLSAGPCKNIGPVVGTKNALVLLTEFKDTKHTSEPVEIEKTLFSKGSKSFRDYYLEASWNQLDIDGKVSNQWYRARNNRSNYIDDAAEINYPLAQKLVKETVINAKNSGNIDFSPFAVDGKIELLIVTYAGKGFDTTLKASYIRPHQGWLSEPVEVQNGVFADRYVLVPELPIYDIGCYCHEVGHLLGLPDFYNMKSPVVGGWCVMSVGDHIDEGRTPAHPSAWCKVHLGWREPVLLDKTPDGYDIPAILDDDGTIYRIDVQGSGGREYFLLENRQQKGFDQKLPGSGLLIWHVDENNCFLKAPNSDLNNLFITLVQSDGGDELQQDITQYLKEEGYDAMMKEFTGDDGDPYPGITYNRNFDEKSNPRSVSKKGTDSLVRVNGITDSGDVMKADMGVQLQNAVNESPEPQESVSETSTRDTARINLQAYMDAMTKQEDETPYDEGYEAGKLDILRRDKDIKLFKKSYRQRYNQGRTKSGRNQKGDR